MKFSIQNRLLLGAFPDAFPDCPLPLNGTVCNDVAALVPAINRPAGGTACGCVGKGVGGGVG